MDYKKKYEDAVKELKKFFINDNDRILYKHDVEHVFPELKESEDERIRKEIISYLRGCYGAGSEDHLISKRKEWIAWLENKVSRNILIILNQSLRLVISSSTNMVSSCK